MLLVMSHFFLVLHRSYFDKTTGWFEKDVETEVDFRVHAHVHPGQIAARNVPYTYVQRNSSYYTWLLSVRLLLELISFLFF